MTKKWFKKMGLIYIPTSITGVFITLLACIFCITVFIAVDRNSHSVSDTLYGVFPYFICALVVFFWIASGTSQKQEIK